MADFSLLEPKGLRDELDKLPKWAETEEEAAQFPEGTVVLVLSALVPTAPTGLTATAGGEEVLLSWTPSSSTGARAPDGHRVYRNTLDDFEGATQAGVSLGPQANELVDGDVTAEVEYFYWVVAFNEHGESAPSTVDSAVPFTPVSWRDGLTTQPPVAEWYWDDQGVLTDVRGGFHGTYTGTSDAAAFTAVSEGSQDWGTTADNSNRAEVPFHVDLAPTGSWSIQIWMDAAANADNNHRLFEWRNSDDSGGFRVFVQISDVGFRFTGYPSGENEEGFTGSPSGIIDLVITYDGSVVRWYHDGSQVHSFGTPTIDPPDGVLIFGNRVEFDRGWIGLLDLPALWHYPLSAAEVSALHEAATGGG